LCVGKLVEFGQEPGQKGVEAVESFCLTLSGISLDHMRHATEAAKAAKAGAGKAKAASTRTTDSLVLFALKCPSLSLLLQHLIRLNVKSANSFSCCNPDFFIWPNGKRGRGRGGENPPPAAAEKTTFASPGGERC